MDKNDYKGIWIYAEQEHGKLAQTPLELLSKAKELKKINGEEISAVLLGFGVERLAETLFEHGADTVILAEHEALAEYSARPYARVVSAIAEKYMPSIFLLPASTLGRDLAPRVMCRLHTGLTADSIDLEIGDDGILKQIIPTYGGNIRCTIEIRERRPQMTTVRPRVFEVEPPETGRRGTLIRESVEVGKDCFYEVLGTEEKHSERQPISEAKALVSCGRGLKSPEDISMMEELAELIGGELACSRPLVDCGWLEHELQIGQSGSTVRPELIINIGISGAMQYMAGMQKSKTIISVNRDPQADIMQNSHLALAADYRRLIPALINEIKRRKNPENY